MDTSEYAIRLVGMLDAKEFKHHVGPGIVALCGNSLAGENWDLCFDGVCTWLGADYGGGISCKVVARNTDAVTVALEIPTYDTQIEKQCRLKASFEMYPQYVVRREKE
jgi:hypothetical protein